MKYKFPKINHINDVLPFIKDNNAFIVVKKDDYTVINYLLAGNETFPDISEKKDIIFRECRGLIFDNETGKVLSRRFHKFFNLGERIETHFSKIDLNKRHFILEKLDGSMVTPILLKSGLRWATKMGVTDTAISAENYIIQHPKYEIFAKSMLEKDLTPIFEWCSRKNRIVIDYPEDALILTAIRDMTNGTYITYNAMKALGEKFEIPVVKAFISKSKNINSIIEWIKNNSEGEGIIIRFEDNENEGHMIKLKSDWYVRVHKAKDNLRFEKNLISVIINEEADDLKSTLMENDVAKINFYEKKILQTIKSVSKQLDTIVAEGKSKYDNRKDFAIHVAAAHPQLRGLIFNVYDGIPAQQAIIDTIKKSCYSDSGIEKIRALIGVTKEDWIKWEENENQ